MNVTENVIGNFSVTIDCVRFLIRGFSLYTYSKVTLLSNFFEHLFTFRLGQLADETTNPRREII